MRMTQRPLSGSRFLGKPDRVQPPCFRKANLSAFTRVLPPHLKYADGMKRILQSSRIIWPQSTMPRLPSWEESLTLKRRQTRSEEHTSELQSQFHLVCPLLLAK